MQEKITLKNPIVEIKGDEMTRVVWEMIKKELINPYINLVLDTYDLSLQNRDATDDKVTIEAANAIKKHGVGVKCATITPKPNQVKEHNLKRQYKSPNGTIRKLLNGAIFREPLIARNILPHVRNWKKSIIIGRHPFGDIYDGAELKAEKPGVARLVFEADDGEVISEDIARMETPGPLRAMYNLDSSIEGYARACFNLALSKNVNLIFSAKETISTVYDQTFVDIFERVHSEFKEKFEAADLVYQNKLIDAAAEQFVKTEGQVLWALKNYEGDVISDMIGTSVGMVNSALVSPEGHMLFDATHGTIPDQYKAYLEKKETSVNISATTDSWASAIRQRGVLDNNPGAVHYANCLAKAPLATIERGIITRDLANATKTGEGYKVVRTEEFVSETRKTFDTLFSQ